jgi:aminobenzoyl-glutamate transport protein
MLGVRVSEESGLVAALIRKLVLVASPKSLTYILMFVGIMSSVAADAGYLVLVPLAAAAFASVGRNPLAGLAASFAGVAAVFSVNIFVKPLDGILVGIANDAIHLTNPNLSISLTSNLWFSIASVVLLTVVVSLITDKWVEPRLGPYTGDAAIEPARAFSEAESRGLKYALWGLVALLVVFALLTIPPRAVLRNPETGALIGNSPFMNGLIALIALLFLVVGAAYGIGAGTMRSTADVVRAMEKAIAGSAA